jgi:hypothetical protein
LNQASSKEPKLIARFLQNNNSQIQSSVYKFTDTLSTNSLAVSLIELPDFAYRFRCWVICFEATVDVMIELVEVSGGGTGGSGSMPH